MDVEKLNAELEKAKLNNVKNFLIISYKINIPRKSMDAIIKEYPLDIAISPLIDFIVTMTVMLNNEMRKNFVLKMYEVLQELEAPDHLRDWDKIVREKLSKRI